jgi:hypothetical protein
VFVQGQMALNVLSEISENFRDTIEFCFQCFSTLFHSINTEQNTNDHARMSTPSLIKAPDHYMNQAQHMSNVKM